MTLPDRFAHGQPLPSKANPTDEANAALIVPDGVKAIAAQLAEGPQDG